MGSGCFSCTKYLFVFLNFIFLIFGIVGIAGSVYMLVDPTFSFRFTQNPGDATISVIILLVASIILFVAGIVGITATLKEKRWGIIMCFSLLLIIVVAEVSAGVWGYIHRDSLETQIRLTVKETVEHDYNENNNNIRALFDTFQEKLECCGAEKPSDWQNTGELNLGISTSKSTFTIPQSCCRRHLKPEQCVAATRNLMIGARINYDAVYDKGCYTLIMDKLKDYVNVILAVGGAILAVQILGLILGLCLAFSINRSNRYKA